MKERKWVGIPGADGMRCNIETWGPRGDVMVTVCDDKMYSCVIVQGHEVERADSQGFLRLMGDAVDLCCEGLRKAQP